MANTRDGDGFPESRMLSPSLVARFCDGAQEYKRPAKIDMPQVACYDMV